MALHQVAINRQRKKALGYNQPQPRKIKPVFPDLNEQHISPETAARGQYCSDILATEALFATIPAIPDLPVQIAGLHGEPGPPFGSPGANNSPTTTGLHANKKPVRTLTLDDRRLEGALHLKIPG